MLKITRLMSFVIGVFLLSLPGMAEDSVMKVTSTDGSVVSVKLVDQMLSSFWLDKSSNPPQIHIFVYSGSIVIGDQGPVPDPEAGDQAGTVWFDAPIANVDKISFEGNISSVESAMAPEVKVNIFDGKVDVTGVTKTIPVSIHKIDGTTVLNNSINSDSTFDLSKFGNGLYVMIVGTQSFKIYIKK